MGLLDFCVLTLNLRLRPESIGSFGKMEKLALKVVLYVEEHGCVVSLE